MTNLARILRHLPALAAIAACDWLLIILIIPERAS